MAGKVGSMTGALARCEAGGGLDAGMRLLVAEDNPADSELVLEMLRQVFGERHHAVCVNRFEAIFTAMDSERFDLLILDMNLPDRSGIDNISDLGERYPQLAIVVLTGNDDLDEAARSLQVGAQDYLCKNRVTPDSLSRSLRYASERKQVELKLKDAIREAEHKNALLESLAKHDALTELPNRTYFQDTGEHMLQRARRAGKQVALLYFDLDGFKQVNDTYGHRVGDELLEQVAGRLRNVLRDSDFLARLGGDEFVLLTDMLDHNNQVYPLLMRINHEFDRPFELGPYRVSTRTSIGVAFFPAARSLDLLVKQADVAMYQAKEDPTSNVCFYSGSVAARFSRHQEIENELGRAVQGDEFSTRFQPLLCAGDGACLGVEALVRWHSGKLGEVPTAEFIRPVERSPVAGQLTRIVVEDCSRLYAALRESGVALHRVAINIGVAQLVNSAFPDQLARWLDGLALPLERLCLEVAEGQVTGHLDSCRQRFARLRDLGVAVAVDDYGSGQSSVTQLANLPLDVLKLDRVLVARLDADPRNQAIVAGIVEMAHRLGMAVVAEGVEREAEKDRTVELGCDYLQGHYFSRPLEHEPVLDYLRGPAALAV